MYYYPVLVHVYGEQCSYFEPYGSREAAESLEDREDVRAEVDEEHERARLADRADGSGPPPGGLQVWSSVELYHLYTEVARDLPEEFDANPDTYVGRIEALAADLGFEVGPVTDDTARELVALGGEEVADRLRHLKTGYRKPRPALGRLISESDPQGFGDGEKMMEEAREQEEEAAWAAEDEAAWAEIDRPGL